MNLDISAVKTLMLSYSKSCMKECNGHLYNDNVLFIFVQQNSIIILKGPYYGHLISGFLFGAL